ncbi:MAG: hypothetical protein Athens101426_157 [Parcubacteria group bacterium Athens1014_26]|nr:MAG: hypothetical protein Athens101426_157 [Parcubacteria group bacterium Athens1014_26]
MDTLEKTSPKDFFLHLLAIITLYVSSTSLVTLLFQYIDMIFPDVLNPVYYESVASSIRYAMASLIIIFPVYIFISWLLNREYAAVPEKRELKIRKWLIYFTLFLAAVAIIIDLVTLIYNFLGGELTFRFILKIITVLLVAGTIFTYYFKEFKKPLASSSAKILTWTVSAVVLLSIAAGFFTAGSPLKARLYTFDQRKIGDLQIIQSTIINYWTYKNALPVKLSDLNDSISGFTVPLDPQTNISYEYAVRSSLSFELCANFNLAVKNNNIYPQTKPAIYTDGTKIGGTNDSWDHESGRQCFSRTIDPALYRKSPITP